MATNLNYDSKKIRNNLSEHEQYIKSELERWIKKLEKETELNFRLEKAFRSDTSHTQLLSEP